MSTVPTPVSADLLPILNLLETLYATNPLVAGHVVPIVKEAFNFALTSGKEGDPEVWVRALKAAIIEIETLKADDVWLSRLPVERGE